MVKVRKGVTRKCKKGVMSHWNECTLCYEHWAKHYRDTHNVLSAPEPWTLLHFPAEPSTEHLRPKTLARLRSLLRHGPDPHATHEGDGYIYVYTLDCDTRHGDPWFKIGRTTQAVHERLKDWPGARLMQFWSVRWNVFSETLIHAWLQHWRAYRFVLYAAKQRPGQHKRYLSLWYDPSPEGNGYDVVPDWVTYGYAHRTYDVNEWVPDHLDNVMLHRHVSQTDVDVWPRAPKGSSQRYAMEQEWFYCPWCYVEHVIQSIVDVVNAPFERRHAEAFDTCD